MTFITLPMLVNAISAQDDIFVTHDVVRFLYTNYQHEYLQELMANTAAKYPFTETHRQLGQALLQLRHLIRKVSKVPSGRTMRGRPTSVQKWEKV
jgi:hypothetical protein